MTNPLAPLASIATAEIGTRETGSSNAGAAILKYQQATDLPGQGWPWCAAFVDWCIERYLHKYPARLSITAKTRPRTASVANFLSWARKNNQLVFTPARPDGYTPQAGDIVIFTFSHIGIVTEHPSPRIVRTVEGNTNDAGSREGYMVAARRRPFAQVRAFIRLATVPLRR